MTSQPLTYTRPFFSAELGSLPSAKAAAAASAVGGRTVMRNITSCCFNSFHSAHDKHGGRVCVGD